MFTNRPCLSFRALTPVPGVNYWLALISLLSGYWIKSSMTISEPYYQRKYFFPFIGVFQQASKIANYVNTKETIFLD